MICSPSNLKQEISKIKKILLDNGYPEYILNKEISLKIAQFTALPKFGPHKCPVHLKIPWIANVSQKFEKQISSAITQCYGSVQARVVYTIRKMMSHIRKDVLPATQQSMVIYEYTCYCDSRYVGRTSQRLADRITQHIPALIRKSSTQTRKMAPRACKTNMQPTQVEHASAIGQHLIENSDCAANYNAGQFTVIAKGRSRFHLSCLEAVFISTRRPVLCRQKQFVNNLSLFPGKSKTGNKPSNCDHHYLYIQFDDECL